MPPSRSCSGPNGGAWGELSWTGEKGEGGTEGAHLKGLVRFLTMVMLAMADYGADRTVSLRTFQGDLG